MGTDNTTKDVPNSWRIVIVVRDDAVLVRRSIRSPSIVCERDVGSLQPTAVVVVFVVVVVIVVVAIVV